MSAKRPSSSSIRDFCARHNIDESTFYRHPQDMPRTIKIGGQKRILDEDEQAWKAKKQESAGRAA